MNRSLPCIDGLAVTYLVFTGGLLLLGWQSGWVYRASVLIHLGTAGGIVALSVASSLPRGLRGLRQMYPILLLLLFYAEVDLYVKLLHDPPGYDALVESWDAVLFGGHPHVYLSEWLSGRVWAELFHFFYVSYYALVAGSFFFVWQRHPRAFPRFSFVVTGMFASYMAIFMAFPVAGPLADAGTTVSATGVFPRLVSWIYAPLRMNGIATGAFPSSHVGMSVGIVCLIAPRRWWSWGVLWALVGGIAVSTTYGGFHYAVDAVAGAGTGWALYRAWTALFSIVRAHVATPAENAADAQISAASAGEPVSSNLER